MILIMNIKVNEKSLIVKILCKRDEKREISSPKSSVEVAISFLLEVLLISIDFPLVEALRNLDCNSFFSVKKERSE